MANRQDTYTDNEGMRGRGEWGGDELDVVGALVKPGVYENVCVWCVCVCLPVFDVLDASLHLSMYYDMCEVVSYDVF